MATTGMQQPETAVTMSETRTTGFTATMEVLTEDGPQQLSSPAILGRRIKVWTGTGWAEGMPRQVPPPQQQPDGAVAKAVEIITSEGRLLRCSATQGICMADGSVRPAGELRVGDALARSVTPAYPGSSAHSVSDAFKRGTVFGAAMTNFSPSMAPEFPVRVGIPQPQDFVLVDMRIRSAPTETHPEGTMIRNPHLVALGYAEKRVTGDGKEVEVDVMRDKAVSYARAHRMDIDHSEKALVLLEPELRTPQACPLAPLRDRMHWSAGGAFVTHGYSTVTGVRAHVVAFAAMVNSCGPKFEINVRCTDSAKNVWEARPFGCASEDRAPPTVFSISRVMGTPALHNVDGVDTLMINGQLVSNQPQ